MSTQPSYVSLGMLLGLPEIATEEMLWQFNCDLRVAVPGVVVAVHQSPLTVDVQPAVQENIFRNLVPTPVNLPVLQQIPVAIYGAGSFVVTLPIQVGDECMVIFQDMCINRWRVQGAPTSGPVPNQEERRRHDLSDGIAVFGLWSNPRAIGSYSASKLQVRSLDAQTVVEVGSGEITLTPDGGTSLIKIAPGEIDLTATLVKINGTNFHAHIHSGVTTGAGVTGPVTP